MKSLARSVGRGLSAGEPLPDPWPIFKQKQITFRRSSMQMISGPPGSMKTVMMLNIVKGMGPNVPTLYHSSDSDDFTVVTRAYSMLTGVETNAAEEFIAERPVEAAKTLRQLGNVHWNFHSSPDLDRLWDEADAFREVWGEYPHHTVIDILMDVDYEGAGEQNYWRLMGELKTMAREQETSLTIVHHTSESAKGGTPPPRSAIMGKASQLPTVIMTLWGDAHAGTLDVAVVKNRFGPQDALAKKFFRMKADPSICLIEEDPVGDLLFRDGTSVPDDEKIDLFKDEEEAATDE